LCENGRMDISKLKHPAWSGVVMPLALAVGSTFTPATIRGALLVLAVIAIAGTIHNTEFGAKRWRVTGIALLISTTLAVGVFFIGSVVDANSKPKPTAVEPARPG
jgi:hypothetical protein